MKKLAFFPMAIICLAGISLYAQSLGDFAREEQHRRDSISSSRTTTLKYTPPVLPVEKILIDDAENEDDENGSPQSAKKSSDGDSSEKAAPKEDTDLYGNTESYWRNTMSDARNRVARLEDAVDELTSRRNALQLQHNRTNGAKRGAIKDEIDRTVQALEQSRNDLEQARKELQSLREEARSNGALPGWIE